MNAPATERQRRAARLREDPTLRPHGDPNTYRNWGCTCGPCKESVRAPNRRGQAVRTEKARALARQRDPRYVTCPHCPGFRVMRAVGDAPAAREIAMHVAVKHRDREELHR